MIANGDNPGKIPSIGRGWLTRHDVLNTRTLAQPQPLLARTMGGAGSTGGSGTQRSRSKGA
ncbi:phosphoesterase [Burkholderia sola]|nr:phosphoesterase [Burkholderia cenocepacia]CAG2348746.1 phosphoesterase [Burkholderia cenocepacia]CAG2348796.1 phosphoesterase [Burkholderia cenocepacia]CAG2348879.1 phosphoesterase [Burkholderia cenocepacia]CAG2348915.1 phosphoesterase [Burkholderia cenocepacia]